MLGGFLSAIYVLYLELFKIKLPKNLSDPGEPFQTEKSVYSVLGGDVTESFISDNADNGLFSLLNAVNIKFPGSVKSAKSGPKLHFKNVFSSGSTVKTRGVSINVSKNIVV